MTSQPIPACCECKYYYEDEIFSFCKFHYFETPNYITGNINKYDMFCVDAREKDRYCGHEGKNFEQRQTPVEENEESFWEYVKGFFAMNWMF